MIRALAIALAIALLALAGTGYLAHTRELKLDTAARTHDADAKRINTLTQAGHDNATTITSLHEKLDQCAGQDHAVDVAASTATDDANHRAQARDAALDALQRARGQTYATDPTAAQWAALPMPADLSGQLRQQWDTARRGDGH